MSALDNNPFESLHQTMVASPHDHSINHRDAWIYGIVVGWDEEEGGTGAIMEVADRHGWSLATVARLRDLRRNFLAAAESWKEARP